MKFERFWFHEERELWEINFQNFFIPLQIFEIGYRNKVMLKLSCKNLPTRRIKITGEVGKGFNFFPLNLWKKESTTFQLFWELSHVCKRMIFIKKSWKLAVDWLNFWLLFKWKMTTKATFFLEEFGYDAWVFIHRNWWKYGLSLYSTCQLEDSIILPWWKFLNELISIFLCFWSLFNVLRRGLWLIWKLILGTLFEYRSISAVLVCNNMHLVVHLPNTNT